MTKVRLMTDAEVDLNGVELTLLEYRRNETAPWVPIGIFADDGQLWSATYSHQGEHPDDDWRTTDELYRQRTVRVNELFD